MLVSGGDENERLEVEARRTLFDSMSMTMWFDLEEYLKYFHFHDLVLGNDRHVAYDTTMKTYWEHYIEQSMMRLLVGNSDTSLF